MPILNRKKGQVIVTGIIVSTLALAGTLATAWATASKTVGESNAKIQVIEERESNHFLQLTESTERIERKLDRLIENIQ